MFLDGATCWGSVCRFDVKGVGDITEAIVASISGDHQCCIAEHDALCSCAASNDVYGVYCKFQGDLGISSPA